MSEDAKVFRRGPGGAGPVYARLRLAAPLRELLAVVVGRVRAALALAPDEAALPGGGAPDVELQAAWREGLRESDARDTHALLALLEQTGFGTSDRPLEPANAEGVIRASVRVRLHLRETALRELATEDLAGASAWRRRPPAQQQSFLCYQLLIQLEGDLLAQLDPGASPA